MNTYPSMKPFRPLGTLFAFLFATILKIEHEKEYIFTGEFDLDHIKDAYDEAVNNKTDLVKAVIKIK